VPVGNFAVNPFVRSRDPATGQEIGQVIISSNAGRIFGTVNNGLQWLVIGEPTDLDSSYAPALAYGSPQGLPGGGTGSLNSFLYAGTVRGNIFVTFTGGGAPGSGQWINLAAGAKAGDLANNTDGVLQIIPSPVRDSREVYAVTTAGVFHLQDSSPSSPAAWRRITGNLFALLQVPFGGPGVAQTPPGSAGAGPVPLLQTTAFRNTYLTSLQVDWRYTIPDAVPRAGDPSPTHPVLYVAGLGGVFRSLDDGGTWTAFPSADAMLEGAVRDGGYLPVVRVSDLDLAVGPIEPTTGRPGGVGPGVLLATTYGRGSFAIRVGPTVIPNTVQPGILALDAADRLGGNPLITANPRPTVTGVSQQSDPGLPVTVNLFDAATGTPIGTGQTDFNGNFRITLLPFYTTPGLKTIAVQATDQAGIAGNVARLTFFLENASPLPPLYLPDLAPDSDTGRPRPPRDADDLTNLPLPSFQGTLDPGATVEIFVNGVLAGTGTADATGFYRVTLTVPLAEGPNVITLREIGAAGDVGPISPPITVTLDTVSPTPIIARLLPRPTTPGPRPATTSPASTGRRSSTPSTRRASPGRRGGGPGPDLRPDGRRAGPADRAGPAWPARRWPTPPGSTASGSAPTCCRRRRPAPSATAWPTAPTSSRRSSSTWRATSASRPPSAPRAPSSSTAPTPTNTASSTRRPRPTRRAGATSRMR
jgi:hypothetical protein